jgi:hypothetical protein
MSSRAPSSATSKPMVLVSDIGGYSSSSAYQIAPPVPMPLPLPIPMAYRSSSASTGGTSSSTNTSARSSSSSAASHMHSHSLGKQSSIDYACTVTRSTAPANVSLRASTTALPTSRDRQFSSAPLCNSNNDVESAYHDSCTIKSAAARGSSANSLLLGGHNHHSGSFLFGAEAHQNTQTRQTLTHRKGERYVVYTHTLSLSHSLTHIYIRASFT